MSTIRTVGFSALALGVGAVTELIVNRHEDHNTRKVFTGGLLAGLGVGVALAPHTPAGTGLPLDLARRIEQEMRPFTAFETKLAKGMWFGGLLMVGFGAVALGRSVFRSDS